MVIKNKYIKPDLAPDEKLKLEKAFTLDCVAIGTLATDNVSYNPKLASGIPPYNSQKDRTLKKYFKSPVVKKTLKKTGQDDGGDSISGKHVDKYTQQGGMGKYIQTRNRSGAGYSTMEVAGHDFFMTKPKSCIGFNGAAGYRRTTPDLRTKPSVFEGKRR